MPIAGWAPAIKSHSWIFGVTAGRHAGCAYGKILFGERSVYPRVCRGKLWGEFHTAGRVRAAKRDAALLFGKKIKNLEANRRRGAGLQDALIFHFEDHAENFGEPFRGGRLTRLSRGPSHSNSWRFCPWDRGRDRLIQPALHSVRRVSSYDRSNGLHGAPAPAPAMRAINAGVQGCGGRAVDETPLVGLGRKGFRGAPHPTNEPADAVLTAERPRSEQRHKNLLRNAAPGPSDPGASAIWAVHDSPSYHVAPYTTPKKYQRRKDETIRMVRYYEIGTNLRFHWNG